MLVFQIQTDEADNETGDIAEDNSNDLIKFLKQVEPLISKALTNGSKSRAFDGMLNASAQVAAFMDLCHILFFMVPTQIMK